MWRTWCRSDDNHSRWRAGFPFCSRPVRHHPIVERIVSMATPATTEQAAHKPARPFVEPIAMRVPDACRFIGIGRSTLYVLIGRGEVETIKIGSSTLVMTESLKRLISSRRRTADQTERNAQ